MPPRISIITPSFNQAPFLKQTIDSVLSQNYPNLQYIIIDGGSTDGSVEIIRKYAPHLAYWVSEPDRGQAHALNKGFARATGSIHAYLNSDDYYEKGALETAAEMLSDASTAWLCGALRYFDDSGFERTDFYEAEPPDANAAFDWFYRYRINQPATFWTADLTAACGPFNETLRYVFDWEFFTRIRFHHNVPAVPVKKILAHFRLHPASKTVSASDAFETEIDSIFNDVLRPLPPRRQRLARQRRLFAKADRLQVRSLALAQNRQRLGALSSLFHSIALYPPILLQRRTLGCLRRAAIF